MNILMKKPGIMMIDQYGSKYIRFIAGEINDSILQCRITEDEAAKIQGEELTMESVLNYYDNQGDCSPGNLQDALLKDYLRTVSEYSEQRINRIVEKLKTHGDIFFEFYDYVLYEKFVDDGITIEGFTAEYLANNYPLSPLGAYNYLIYLREMPEKALADLKAGLPSRDSTYREVGNQQKEEQSSMEEKVPVQLEEVEQSPQTAPESSDTQRNLLAKLEAIQKAIAGLQQTFDDKIAEDAHKNGLFDNMHLELTRYQNGAMDKIVDTMALDIIQLVDTTKGHIRVYEKKEPTEDNYKRLLRIVKGIAEDLQDILYRQNIESYRVDGHEVDVRRQKIIQTVPTDDQSKDNLVAVRIADGYEKAGKVLRPERIKIFKYSSTTTDTTEN
mgnify:CR=1 FL=1